MPATSIAFGEIALSGEVRPVSLAGLRLKEAAKLGFEQALAPASTRGECDGLSITGFSRLGGLVDFLLRRG